MSLILFLIDLVGIDRRKAESAVETLHNSHSRVEFWESDMNLT